MFKNLLRNNLIAFIIFCFSLNINGQVRLPKLISDGMILQRNKIVKIWGWASPNENVNVKFLDHSFQTQANGFGDWSIDLPKQKAGGPYEMEISASNNIIIHNILFGDVWLCSGQSNMELPMSRVSWNYPGEIEKSENKFIRQFIVPDKYNFDGPQKDLISGSWKSASPENTPNFSAAAYFFAKNVYSKYNIPVGIINSALGGSPVESWISSDSLMKFPKYFNEAQIYKDTTLIEKIDASDNSRHDAWYNLLRIVDEGYKNPNQLWTDPNLNDKDWFAMKVPGYWADETELGNINGVVWFRKNINIPSSMIGKPATLILGRIVDADSTFINGKFIGTVGYQYPPSRFEIPLGVFKEGENSIVVRVISDANKGGFVLDKPYEIVSNDDTLDLVGEWKYKLGAEMPPLQSQTFIRWKPIGLYNAMIAPLLNYKIKGALWYQGEANAARPEEYNSLFTTMINDWRSKWKEGEFPFLFVQLPNFMEAKKEPSESNWALLREAQLQTLSLPNTGMAITIDIGEWNDIHPLDKKDVGDRLFKAAEKVAYGDDKIIYSGPIYKSMKIEGNKILISFDHVGNGLISKGNGKLKGFAIAGKDKKFVWANAKIVQETSSGENNSIAVWSDKIDKPIAVRYAWADNPDNANLYNSAGLPASPFRTDKFK